MKPYTHIYTKKTLRFQILQVFLSFFLWPCLEACRIFVSPLGIKPIHQHWTDKEFPKSGRFKRKEETKAKISMPKGFQENERQMMRGKNIHNSHYNLLSYLISLCHQQLPQSIKKGQNDSGEKQRKDMNRGFPGGSVVKNLPANTGNTGSIPDLGRFQRSWSN